MSNSIPRLFHSPNKTNINQQYPNFKSQPYQQQQHEQPRPVQFNNPVSFKCHSSNFQPQMPPSDEPQIPNRQSRNSLSPLHIDIDSFTQRIHLHSDQLPHQKSPPSPTYQLPLTPPRKRKDPLTSSIKTPPSKDQLSKYHTTSSSSQSSKSHPNPNINSKYTHPLMESLSSASSQVSLNPSLIPEAATSLSTLTVHPNHDRSKFIPLSDIKVIRPQQQQQLKQSLVNDFMKQCESVVFEKGTEQPLKIKPIESLVPKQNQSQTHNTSLALNTINNTCSLGRVESNDPESLETVQSETIPEIYGDSKDLTRCQHLLSTAHDQIKFNIQQIQTLERKCASLIELEQTCESLKHRYNQAQESKDTALKEMTAQQENLQLFTAGILKENERLRQENLALTEECQQQMNCKQYLEQQLIDYQAQIGYLEKELLTSKEHIKSTEKDISGFQNTFKEMQVQLIADIEKSFMENASDFINFLRTIKKTKQISTTTFIPHSKESVTTENNHIQKKTQQIALSARDAIILEDIRENNSKQRNKESSEYQKGNQHILQHYPVREQQQQQQQQQHRETKTEQNNHKAFTIPANALVEKRPELLAKANENRLRSCLNNDNSEEDLEFALNEQLSILQTMREQSNLNRLYSHKQ